MPQIFSIDVRHYLDKQGKRTLTLDELDHALVTEDGVEVEKTTTEGVVAGVKRL